MAAFTIPSRIVAAAPATGNTDASATVARIESTNPSMGSFLSSRMRHKSTPVGAIRKYVDHDYCDRVCR